MRPGRRARLGLTALMLMLPKPALKRGTPGVEAQVIVRELPASHAGSPRPRKSTRVVRDLRARTNHSLVASGDAGREDTRDTVGHDDVPRARAR